MNDILFLCLTDILIFRLFLRTFIYIFYILYKKLMIKGDIDILFPKKDLTIFLHNDE